MEKVGRQLRLTPAGRLLTMFLQLYFTQYVDYGFTSDMEAQLDSVSGGSAVSPCPVWTFFCADAAAAAAQTALPAGDGISIAFVWSLWFASKLVAGALAMSDLLQGWRITWAGAERPACP